VQCRSGHRDWREKTPVEDVLGEELFSRGEEMATALHRSFVALGVGFAAFVAMLGVGVSEAFAGPSFPLPYALKTNWNSVNIASVVAVIAAVTIVQFALVAVVLRRRQRVAPVLAESISAAQVGDTSASNETKKAA
jgi:hypothetical protein